MTTRRSTRAIGIPLYLLPQAISLLIRIRGVKVYRISVKRTHLHHYNVSVRTRSLQKELRPVREKFPEQDRPQVHSDDDCQGGIA